MANACCWRARKGSSPRNVSMMDVSPHVTCWIPVSGPLVSAPDCSMWKLSACRTNVKDKCVSSKICYAEPSRRSSEFICFLNCHPLSPRIHSRIQYALQAVDMNRNDFFGVKVSLKDVCPLRNDDDKTPALDVLWVIYKSKKGLLLCIMNTGLKRVRPSILGQRCD